MPTKTKWLITIFLFVIIFCVRLPYLSASPYEIDHSWRQGDTESMARNFVEHKFNIFYPQVNYDGPLPNYVQLEFQITTFIIAILYKLFGYHYELARIVPLFFFMGSVVFLFLIAKNYYSIITSWVTIVIYSFLPLPLYYSRAIMPEAAALFFFIGSFYFFDQWIKKEKLKYVIWAGTFTTLAIMVKATTIFIGIAQLAIAIRKFKGQVFFRLELWLFAILSLLIPFIYYKVEEHIAELKFVSEIASLRIFPNFATEFLKEGAQKFFIHVIPEWFGIFPILLLILGFLTLNWRKEFSIGVWCLSMILEALLVVSIIKYPYYLIFLTPIIAILGGRFLGIFEKTKIGVIGITLVVLLLSLYNLNKMVPLYQDDTKVTEMAHFIEKYTKKDDLIVVSSLNPAVINASNRVGWRVNLGLYDFIPKGPQKEFAYYIKNGAKYFIARNEKIYQDVNDQYRIYLESHFPKYASDKNFTIYKLR